MDKRTVGENNILKALKFIHKFGWLRSQEIGLFLWIESVSYKKNSEALVRKLIDQNLVIARKLPQNSGSALFLSKQGADALLELGILANSGKSYGSIIEGVWSPPSNWKHHLLSVGALGHLFREGYGVISELEIRRKYDLKKYPDGIFFVDDENEKNTETYWLEVENHRKTGQNNMGLMVDSALRSLVNNSLNDNNQLLGRSVNRIAFAYSPTSRDENNHTIDHKLRVTNAFEKKVKRDLPINFIALETYGLGVSSISEKEVTIKAKPQSLYA